VYSYCTLFDKNYLDKGLVLIDSLRKYNTQSTLYILAMDDVCYTCLKRIGKKAVIPIRLSDFETEALLQAKRTRSRGEYCWTCASNLISYVFRVYEEEYCTYIDADLCFYADPDILVEQMIQKEKSVQIVEHRFRQDFSGRFQEKISGRFCVEFNTFKNDAVGMKILEEWCEQTLEQCMFAFGTDKLGDQMYLDVWPQKYSEYVNILGHLGAGVAPWNINRYFFDRQDETGIWIRYDEEATPTQMVFFHFHGLNYLDRNTIDINVHKRFWKLDMELAIRIFEPYIQQLEYKKQWIEREFGFFPLVQGNALGTVDQKRIWERIGNLFKGNVYENIRIRIENHLKILLFRRYDIIKVGK